jgi:hypothetical protein
MTLSSSGFDCLDFSARLYCPSSITTSPRTAIAAALGLTPHV